MSPPDHGSNDSRPGGRESGVQSRKSGKGKGKTMGTEKKFEPFEVFPQFCVKGVLKPTHFGLKAIIVKDGETEEEAEAREKALTAWDRFRKENDIVLPPRGRDGKRRGVTVIAGDTSKPHKDEATSEVIFPLKPAAMPKGAAGWYWRLQVKTPLTRPYDLARVFDAQGKVLNPVARTPWEDKETDKGFVIPAGATEWYVGSAVILVAVNARGRVQVQFWTLDESGGEPKVRVAKWTDLTIPMIEAKLSDPREAKATQARLGDGKNFMDEIREIFRLVNREYPQGRKETDEAWRLRSKREMIADRARWQERKVVEAVKDDSEPGGDAGNGNGHEAAEGGDGKDGAEVLAEAVTNGMDSDDSAHTDA